MIRSIVFLICLALADTLSVCAQSNVLRVMSANLTSGNSQKYETPGIDIFQGLKPDIVAIQEFNFSNNTPSDFAALLNLAFGPGFTYFRETNAGYNLPNGIIISRYPITDAGSWDDPVLSNRGFAWAKITLPNSNDLYMISVHLYASGTDADRNTEATEIKNHILNDLPPGAWVIVAGDFNTSSRTDPALLTFDTILSDNPVPTDAETGGDFDTNAGRNSPYDYVLPSFSLTNLLTAVVLPSHTFPKGLVFDSRVYTPLSDVPPVAASDSGAVNMQHMAVVKDFSLSGIVNTNFPPSISGQPQDQTVPAGSNATFVVTATGSPTLAYQWRFYGTNIAGATGSIYTRTNAQSAHVGPYSVVVTNSFGSVTSSAAMLALAVGNSPMIAQWDFNSLVSDANTTTGVLTPSVGSGVASYVGGTAAPGSGQFAGGGPTDTNTTDNSAWNTSAYPAATASNKTAGVRFDVSTVGRQNITIRWDQRESNTGSKYVRLQYTTNGTSFVDFPTGVSVAAANAFESKTNDLTGVSGVNNNPNFGFRIVAEFESTAINSANTNYVGAGGSYGTGGTVRFDMVTVMGVAITGTNSPPAPPLLGIPRIGTNQTISFTVTGSLGSNYVVQSSTNLTPATWISVTTNTSPFTFIETNSSPRRFYRAIAQ